MPRPSPEIQLELPTADALFDDATKPVFPHTSRMLDSTLSDYIVTAARERRMLKVVSLKVVLRQAAMTHAEEEQVANQIRNYFREEGLLVAQATRVNRAEGWGSAAFLFPLAVLAGLVAFVIYLANYVTAIADVVSKFAFLTAIIYLVFITIVWVLLWDPIEKLMFDGYLNRLAERAVNKLAVAAVHFEYQAPSAAATPTAPAG